MFKCDEKYCMCTNSLWELHYFISAYYDSDYSLIRQWSNFN